MKKMAMSCYVVGLCVVTSTAIFAQTEPTPTDTNRNSMIEVNANSTVSGKVVSTNANTLVIETDAGTRMTFDTNGTTLPYNASVGSRVEIAYAPNQTGTVTRLSTVTVMPATGTATADTRTGATSTDNPDMYASNRDLPKTGSMMPLFGVLGVIALGAGLAVRIVRSLS